MPHIINVNTGEGVTMKVISFSQQGPHAICILSANGVIFSVTLREPDSSGGTLIIRVFDLFLKGCFEIPSLAGSFIPSDSEGIKYRSGGMNVSLSSSNGRVVGGSVAGLLVAASCSKIRRPPRNQNSIIITVTTTGVVPVRLHAAVPVPAPTHTAEPDILLNKISHSLHFVEIIGHPSYNSLKSRSKPTDINVRLQ